MANVIQLPAATDIYKSKTRKFKFSPVPVPQNLPDKENQAGDAVDVVIVQQ